MNKKKLGVWLNKEIKATSGGGFSYYDQIIDFFLNYESDYFIIVFLTNDKKVIHNSQSIDKIKYIHGSNFFKIFNRYFPYTKKLYSDKIKNQLINVCDVIYYPTPFVFYNNFPFINTIWDLSYVSCFAFREFVKGEIFNQRKVDAISACEKSILTVVESEYGKFELINYLRINSQKIKVLDIIPSSIVKNQINVQAITELENTDFIFYPAQFWSHKNHYHLLLGFRKFILDFKDFNIKLVLCGADFGNQSYIIDLITELKLNQQVLILGFIEIEKLKWLYKNSKGMIYPSLLGPSNMPPLEALNLNCPVAVSDIKGHRGQFGDNVIYFNPFDLEEISEAINYLVYKEKKFVNYSSKDFSKVQMDEILKLAFDIRCTWK